MVSAPAVVCLILLAGNMVAQAQSQSGPGVGNESDASAEAPLTPIQEREKAIRDIDPAFRKETADREKAAREAAKHLAESQTVTPGSIAADRQQSGPAVTDPNVVPQYNGPAVLSRSYSINQPAMAKDLKWRESIGVSSSYESGLSVAGTTGANSGAALEGTSVTWALSGGHSFGHDQIGINYTGTMTYYPASSFYTGANQALSANLSHVISKRLQLGANLQLSSSSANAALQNLTAGPGTIANVNLATSPGIAVLDTGSRQYTGGANLTWQLTGRTSFSFTGSSFGVERNSAALYGVSGNSTGAQGTYRLTKKLTVGGSYSYSQYVYPHGSGVSDSQSAGGIFSYALDRSTQVRFNGGLGRVESLGLQTVPLSPIVAALLGQTTGIIDAYNTFRSTNISAQLIRDFRKYGSLSFAYARGISPGNGLFQTSQQESMSLSASRKIFRDYGISLGSGRDKLTSVTQSLGQYASEYASLSVARTYKKGAGVTFGATYRHFEIASFSSLKNQLSITSGFTWSSARLWPF